MDTQKFLLWQEDEEEEEDVVAEDVMVEVTITKANGHTWVDVEDAEDTEEVEEMGYVVVQIEVCDLTTKEIHSK